MRRREYFRSTPRFRFIYSGALVCFEAENMKHFEEIDDCSWQEVYHLNGCYDQFFADEEPEAAEA